MEAQEPTPVEKYLNEIIEGLKENVKKKEVEFKKLKLEIKGMRKEIRTKIYSRDSFVGKPPKQYKHHIDKQKFKQEKKE